LKPEFKKSSTIDIPTQLRALGNQKVEIKMEKIEEFDEKLSSSKGLSSYSLSGEVSLYVDDDQTAAGQVSKNGTALAVKGMRLDTLKTPLIDENEEVFIMEEFQRKIMSPKMLTPLSPLVISPMTPQRQPMIPLEALNKPIYEFDFSSRLYQNKKNKLDPISYGDNLKKKSK
jgi:hypothetical protein